MTGNGVYIATPSAQMKIPRKKVKEQRHFVPQHAQMAKINIPTSKLDMLFDKFEEEISENMDEDKRIKEKFVTSAEDSKSILDRVEEMPLHYQNYSKKEKEVENPYATLFAKEKTKLSKIANRAQEREESKQELGELIVKYTSEKPSNFSELRRKSKVCMSNQ